MRGTLIYFDFRGQIRLRECLLQHVLVIRGPHIVVFCDRDEELRLASRRLQMWTVRFIRDEPTSMERCNCTDTVGYGGRATKRDRAAHAITLCAEFPAFCHGWLPVQPPSERFRVCHMRGFVQSLRQRPELLDRGCGAGICSGSFFDAVKR